MLVDTVQREEQLGTDGGPGTRHALAPGPLPATRLEPLSEVGSNEMLKALVRGGLGIAFTSRLSVGEEVETGHVVVVPVRGFSVRRTFHLVTRRDAHLSPAARSFARLF